MGENADSKAIMQNHPILSLLAYLIDQGSLLEAVNEVGKSGSDVILSLGSGVTIFKLLVQLLTKQSGCMGNKGCNQQPAFLLRCPHKDDYKVCANCFLLTAQKMKCKCPEEKAVSIQNDCLEKLLDLLSSPVGIPATAGSLVDLNANYEFKLIPDGSRYGFLEDQLTNVYTHTVTRRLENIFYSCDKESDSAGRCKAVARRFKEDGDWVTHLEVPHNHPNALKRKFKGKVNINQRAYSKILFIVFFFSRRKWWPAACQKTIMLFFFMMGHILNADVVLCYCTVR